MSGLLFTKKILFAADVDNLPFMTDRKQIATMKMLDLLASYSFQANNVLLLLFSTVKMVRLTIKYGISAAAPSAFAQYGALVLGVLNDLQAAVRIGEMATKMVKRLESQANKSLVTLRTWGFMTSYVKPIHESLKHFLQGHSDGMKFGDTEMASWCLYNHIASSFHVSRPLRIVEEDCRIDITFIRDAGWTEVMEATRYVHLAVLYLNGAEDDASSDLFKDVEVGEQNFSHLTQFLVRSAVYAYTADFEEGAKYAIKIGDAVQKAAPGHMVLQGEVFTRCACLYAMARKTNKSKYKKPARALRKFVTNLRKQGAVNFEHSICLFNAEEAAMARKTSKASSLYQEAILHAARRGLLRDAGLINERYANFLLHDLGEK